VTNLESTRIKDWIDNWKETRPLIERLEIENLRARGISEILNSLDDVTKASLKAHPPLPFSGMFEMQRIFSKIRKNETGP